MGQRKSIKKKMSQKKISLNRAQYSEDSNASICRVFFLEKSFTIGEGISFLKRIQKENEATKCIVTGGGYFKIDLPEEVGDKLNSKNVEIVKKYAKKEIKKISIHISKKQITCPVLMGVDFLYKKKGMPVQLAVYFYKGKYLLVSKSYRTSTEKIIENWHAPREFEVLKVPSVGRVLPLVCNDGVLWAGRSEKGLSSNSQRGKLAKDLKKKFKGYKPWNAPLNL